MVRMFMFAIAMVSFVGCASKADVPSVQSQLDEFKVSVAKEHEEMVAKNVEQDNRLTELETRVDRAFRKGK